MRKVVPARFGFPSFCSINYENWTKWEYGTFQYRYDPQGINGVTATANENIDNSNFLSQLSNDEVVTGIEFLSKFCSSSRLHKMDAIIEQRVSNVRFIFENPSNANNMWAALRTLDSFGIQYIDVIMNGTSYSKEWRRGAIVTALGSQKWLTLQKYPDSKECITQLKKEGWIILASDLSEKSISIHDIQWKTYDSNNSYSELETNVSFKGLKSDNDYDLNDNKDISKDAKYAIIMGNEKTGITKEVKELADVLFHMPMKGFAESFNLSAAAAIIAATLDAKGIFRAGEKLIVQ